MKDDPQAMNYSVPQAWIRKRLFATMVVIIIGGMALAAALFVSLRSEERDQARWEFERSSRDHVAALWKTMEMDFLVMRSVQSFYYGSETIEQDEFAAFTGPLIDDRPSIRSIQWAPCVRKPNQADQFPIEWVEPSNANVAAQGFNLASNPSCQSAIQHSRDTGRIVMTAKMTLSREEMGDQAGVRVFLPVYEKNSSMPSIKKRRESLRGFVVGVLRLKGIAEESLAALSPMGIDIKLIDDSADADRQLLYSYSSRTRILDTAASNGKTDSTENDELRLAVNKEVAGRQWTVVCTATPNFMADRMTYYPLAAALCVLLLTGLLAAYLLRRGQMAAKLVENERKLRGLMDQTFQFIGLLTTDGRIVEANKAALDFIGVRKSNILNRPFWDTPWWNHNPKLQDKIRQAVKRAADGFTVHFEAEMLRSDGIPRWVDFSLKPLRDDDGTVLFLIPEGYDITEHKTAVQRQEQSIERLQSINQLQEELMTPGGMEDKFKKITDAAVQMLDLDFCRIWMIKPGDLCQFGCMHAQVAEGPHACNYRDTCLHLMASSGRYTHLDGDHGRVPFGCYKIGRIASGTDKKFLTNHVATDPRVHNHQWAKELGLVSFAGYKLRDSDDNPIGVLAMFAQHANSDEEDAVMANLAEIASKAILDSQAAEALVNSERRHRLFAENITDVLWTMDFVGNFTYMSPSMEKQMGIKWEEGSQLTIADIMTPSSLALSQKVLENLYAEDKKGNPVETHLELELIRKDGSILWGDVTVCGMYNELNQLIGVQGIMRDISARKKMEQELQKAKEAAESATQAKSRFLARVSHEIRSPMTSILGYTDLLMDPSINQSSRNNYLAVIRRNGEHLLNLINDILDLSKIEVGKFTLDINRCNLPAILADVASMVRPRAEGRGISLTLEYNTELPETILTDGVRLRQALINLAGNAVKFTEQGGVRVVTSFLPVWQGQPAVRIQVIDTGIGIRAEDMPKLFEPFSQGDESVSREFGGTGLGLAVSRHIVILLGGELAATSVYGKGSNFSITVPIGDIEGVRLLENPTEAKSDSCDGPVYQEAKELDGLRILLAEDGYDNRLLIETVLRSAGAVVETVVNGKEAVEKAETESYDVVLMDMNMPVMDGYQATRLLRGHNYERPILALTANAMSDDGVRCINAGCDRHLTKPINRSQLIDTIAVCTGRKEMEEIEKASEEEEASPPETRHAAAGSEPLVSLYADDPDVADILDGFVEGLDEQLADMGHAFAEKRYDDLKRFAHRLKGAGGSYGYPTLTDASKKLEDAAAAKDHPAAEQALEEVAGLCRAVKQGYKTTTVSAGRENQ